MFKQKMGLTKALFCIGAIFSFLATLMAFMITYEEYTHHYTDKRKILKAALEVAFFTLVFFLGLGLLLGFILPLIFK